MNNLKLQVLFTILIAYSGVLLFTLSTNQPNEEKVSNKSIISIDTHINRVYIKYTDDIQLIKSYELAKNDRWLKVKRKQVIEYKRIAAERLVEEKRVAEEKRQVELARVAEEKRVAELVAKRDAKNKLKQENKKTQVASRGKSNNQKWIVFEATHYSAFCNTGCTGKTALGYDVSNTIYHNGKRVIAVDPNVIPLGSIVEVSTSYGTFTAVAADTGGDIKGHRADILVENDNVANDLGRIKVQIKVIK